MPLAYRQGPGIICVLLGLQYIPSPSTGEGEGGGEYQWKHNVSICPLAVCIALDA